MADRITVLAEEGIQRFEMTLHPEKLGAVVVKIAIEGGRAVVRIETSSQLAQQIITSQTAELKEILSQNGLTPGQIHVVYDGAGQNGEEGRPEQENSRPDGEAEETDEDGTAEAEDEPDLLA
ncbi:MAG: flagellar hook-length control protein FliK [Gracilibacteraceae bacterium]|nr:flagellar hook-length control protein FliK [Gracilibacteraceae bacterium]